MFFNAVIKIEKLTALGISKFEILSRVGGCRSITPESMKTTVSPNLSFIIQRLGQTMVMIWLLPCYLFAQSSTVELWPEADLWYTLTPSWRLSMFIPVTKYYESKNRDLNIYLQADYKWVEIPDHVDPPFRFMLTHHSGMMTHPFLKLSLKKI